ncbi:biotin--[acetyl-CoA-carboxylase] ligase [Deltaproteobacteria bacterium Smac51]|nr:biotin--[acetyl-CoA-carboxylase] ligase [Deltaproteobacteria bacterium Smac51]
MNNHIKQTLIIDAPGSVPLYVRGRDTSSIDVAWKFLAESRLPVWGSVLLESQTAGRGRMGRQWQSPAGHIYAALRLPAGPPFDGPGASLALAFFLLQALNDFGWQFELKWSNDLIFEGGKVGGILIESRGRDLIAGVGFNLTAPPEGDWRLERDPGAPPPSALPYAEGPVKLWSALVKQVILLYNEKFEGVTMREVASMAEKFLLWRGRKVRVERPASDPPAPETGLHGRISGLGPDGQLLLDNLSGRFSLWSGTVLLDEAHS